MYRDGNTTVVIARISTLFWDNYDESRGIFKNPHFNSGSIFNEFCILGRMSHMMPLMKHALSLQNGLYRRVLYYTVIPPTISEVVGITPASLHDKEGMIGNTSLEESGLSEHMDVDIVLYQPCPSTLVHPSSLAPQVPRCTGSSIQPGSKHH